MIINCPSRFDQGSAAQFVRTGLVPYLNYPDVTINFSNIGFIDPFSTLVLSYGLRGFLAHRKRKRLGLKFVGIDQNPGGVVSYLKHLGVFRHIGIDLGKNIDEASGSSDYLPLTRIRRDQIMWKGRAMQKEIDHKADRLATVLFPHHSGAGPRYMLAYAIREIIRNSFEHGLADHCIATAQRLPNGKAEIAIADEGIGIFNSLRVTCQFSTPEEALRGALRPGISSQSVTGDDEWANSGFGLYVVSELGRRYGIFEIMSDDHCLSIQGEHQVIKDVSPLGTFVRLQIDTADADYFPNILTNIVSEGEKIASQLPGAIKSASKMSKLPMLFDI